MVNLREQLHLVWRGLDGAYPGTHAHKLASSKWYLSRMDSFVSQAKHCSGPALLASYIPCFLSTAGVE